MPTIEQLVASNMRSRRQELGLTQAELAELAAAFGAPWTQAKIALVETGRRQLGLGETLLLGNVLGVALDQLILGPTPDMSERVTVGNVALPIEGLQRMLNGQPVITRNVQREWTDASKTMLDLLARGQRRKIRQLARRYQLSTTDDTLTSIEANAHGTAERTLAKRLGVPATEIAAASLAMWGQRLIDEREARRSTITPRPPRTAISAELIADLEQAIKQSSDQ